MRPVSLDEVPQLRPDLIRRSIDNDVIIWSPLASEPTVLDPVAAVMLDVVDGDASVRELAHEVSQEVGIAFDIALREVQRTVALFADAASLTTSSSPVTAIDELARREIFLSPCLQCTKDAARSMTNLTISSEHDSIGVACYPPRLSRRLQKMLGNQFEVTPGDVDDVGFVLTGPTGFQRTSRLTDRSGFVHSESRSTDEVLAALASHLTALLPPPPDTVRFRLAVLTNDTALFLCLPPLVYIPATDFEEIDAAGVRVVDRLVADIDAKTGQLVPPRSSWLSGVDLGRGHAGVAPMARAFDRIVEPRPQGHPVGSATSLVQQLARCALGGTPTAVLDAAECLVMNASHRAAPINGLTTDLLGSLVRD